MTTTRDEWRSLVRRAYHHLTGSYVEADFTEPTLAILFESDTDPTGAVMALMRDKGKPISIMDAMLAIDQALPVMLRVTNPNGHEFNVRVIRKGDGWGQHDRLIYDEDRSMVEFYDAKYEAGMFAPLGQFVSRYYVDTFREIEGGLDLHGGVDSWWLGQENVAEVRDWLDARGIDA